MQRFKPSDSSIPKAACSGFFKENVLFMNIALEKCRAVVLHTACSSSSHSILMLAKSSTRLLSTTCESNRITDEFVWLEKRQMETFIV